jgi:hypothetical protein
LFRQWAGIIDPGYNAESYVAGFNGTGRNSAEDSKTEPVVVRPWKKKSRLTITAIVDESANTIRRGIAGID